MCRHRIVLIICTILILASSAAAQSWNPFAPKSSAPAQAQKAQSAQAPTVQKGLARTLPAPPKLPTNPLALDKLLQIPGLTQPSNRPLNQPSLTQRFHDSAQQFMDDAKRVITPPMLQNRASSSGGGWLLPKAPDLRDFSVVPEFLKPKPPPPAPKPTLGEWIALERPE